MKHTWVAYLATGVVAAGAGVAIAGLPSSVPNDLVITEAPPTTATTVAVTTSSAPPVTTSPPTTEAPVVDVTTTTVLATTTTSPTTTTGATTTVPQLEVTLERADLVVAVANGAGVNGLATTAAGVLVSLGYSDVQPVNTAVVEASVVYYALGRVGEAARLAVDAGLDASAVAPIEDAPPVDPAPLVELLLVLGRDQA